MNTIRADLAGLEGETVALRLADLDGLSARAEGPLPREGDDHCDDAVVVVWNGMVARFPALHRPRRRHYAVAVTPICRDFYGSDGTRTRDLRRDRPAF